jgi:LuxR family maltose regulon positive regulatory protein
MLLQTAILDRFCAPLCNVLCPDDLNLNEPAADVSGRDFIEWLMEKNLFVIPLDETARWFRYHHLFQELLQGQLKRRFSSEETAALHVRAKEWFAEKGLIDEAIQHGLASGDEIGVAELVEKNRQAVLNTDRWFALEKWLSVLPDHLIQQRPDLLLAESWIRYHHFDISRIPPLIDAAEALLTDSRKDRSLRGEIDFFRGYFFYFQNDGKLSLKHLDDARKRVLETNHEIRGQIEILYGLARQMQGQKEAALNTLNELLTYARWTEGIARTRLLATLVYIHIISGNLE